MLYEPKFKPKPVVAVWEIVLIIVFGVAALWWGIPAYFRAVAWAGEFAMRHHWL